MGKTKEKSELKHAKQSKPTIEQFTKYQAAYDWFNAELFDSKLSPCLLVFREGKRKKNSIVVGHFAPHRWQQGDKLCHEISLNPEALLRPLMETMSTLVHEMVHQWQQDHGKAPRAGYHDRQWGAKMAEIGLIPSETGHPGGKQTGQKMSHYEEAGGAFLKAFNRMPESIRLPWVSGQSIEAALDPEKEKKARAKNKVKYCCPCGINIWGKPDLQIMCCECEEPFQAEEGEDGE